MWGSASSDTVVNRAVLVVVPTNDASQTNLTLHLLTGTLTRLLGVLTICRIDSTSTIGNATSSCVVAIAVAMTGAVPSRDG